MNRIKKMVFALSLSAICFGMVLGTSPAFGLTWFFPLTGFEDDNMEFLVDSGGVAGTAGNGLIDVGERLVGVAEFNKTYSIIPPGSEAAIAPQELTAVFDLTVLTKSCVAGVCSFTFGATAGGVLAGQPAGTMITLYLDAVDDLNLVAVNCTSQADCIDKANNGAVFLNAGFYGDVNGIWKADGASDSTAAVLGLPSGSTLGGYNLCLNVDAGTNGTGFNFAPQASILCAPGGDGATQLLAGGAIKGGQGLTNGAFARSDNDAQLAPIPEPASLLLLGAGLLGVNFISRRRVKK